MRDRLIELLRDTFNYTKGVCIDFDEAVEINADHLLKNGVIVPPVKVGQKVYRIWSVGKHGKSIANFVVTNVSQCALNTWIVRYQKPSKTLTSYPTIYQCNFEDFGKTVFATKEEAEEALERSENGT